MPGPASLDGGLPVMTAGRWTDDLHLAGWWVWTAPPALLGGPRRDALPRGREVLRREAVYFITCQGCAWRHVVRRPHHRRPGWAAHAPRVVAFPGGGGWEHSAGGGGLRATRSWDHSGGSAGPTHPETPSCLLAVVLGPSRTLDQGCGQLSRGLHRPLGSSGCP